MNIITFILFITLLIISLIATYSLFNKCPYGAIGFFFFTIAVIFWFVQAVKELS